VNYNEKQEQIIITAEKLFAEKGFSGTSVRDIAQEANVNVAMISYYFGSKDKLLEAIFEYRIAFTALDLESLVNDENIAPLQKIYILIDHYTNKFFSNQCFFRLMTREQMKQLEHPELQEIIYNSKKKNFDFISRIIQDGQKRGVFRKRVDVSLMMNTMVGTANQTFFSQMFYRRVNNLESMPDDVFQETLKKKIRLHLKTMFKAVLTHEL